MSATKPETLLVKKITAYLDTVPKCCYEKRHGSMYADAGQPDISACVNGRRVEIEVKVPDKRLLNHKHVLEPIYPMFAKLKMQIFEFSSVKNAFPGNKPSDLQVERLLAWEASGAVAFIAYSVDAVRYVVEKMQRGEIK